MPEQIKTTCPYCGVGCGIITSKDSTGRITIKGDPDHPANFGRLCSKGTALAETLDLEGRLLEPMVDGAIVDWSEALNTVADRFRNIIDQHGPNAVAFYVSGQLLTEDYYVANKLMKGFIGSGNIDTNSRLCMSSAVAAYKRAFGSDTVPCEYEDIEHAELIVITGSNTAWCHPVIYQRIVKAKKENPALRIVVIDPRATATRDIADLHLPLKPGSDSYLFNGLLSYLESHGCRNRGFTDNHCEGLDDALVAARKTASNITDVARVCELDPEDVRDFYDCFASTEKSLTLYSQGINQSSSGTDKANAIINCHLITGRIGRQGMGPFSITGQPNAMGGREVGGLANQLAAHMDIENASHHALVSEFWNAPDLCTEAGLKAVDLFRAVEDGSVKAVWIMATNPVVSMPDADRVREALKGCELVVVSDTSANTDTVDLAHIRLPALGWGEKDGTVTNSERRISRQRKFLKAPGAARADWWIINEVARRMGFESAFDYQSPAEIFSEYATLTGYQNNGSRDLDISGLADLDADSYDNLAPLQWPRKKEDDDSDRIFSDGRFFTAGGKACFIPVDPQLPAYPVSETQPFILNSGRVRDHWHTMTRTGKSPRLGRHTEEPYAEIHPEDASRLNLQENDLVELNTELGNAIVRTRLSTGQRKGSLFAPFHWSDQNSAAARIDALVNPVTDPFSGQPESKHAPVGMRPWLAQWYGFLLSRRELDLKGCGYWSKARGNSIWRYHIAGNQSPADWADLARQWVCSDQDNVEWVEYADSTRNQYRAARIVDNELESCLYVGATKSLPDHDWIEPIFLNGRVQDHERIALLSGRPLQEGQDQGPTVCACFGVGSNQVKELINSGEITSVEQITERLKAGGNCGSCLPELKQLLASGLPSQSAA
ncbi:MAG: molybdopterin-dependent oxidoreductase [Sedimenticola sp.]